MTNIGAIWVLVLLAGVGGCSQDPGWYEYRWAFSCADGTYFICRDEGYFHCDGAPPTYEPGPSCTRVSAICTSDPEPGQSEAQAACGPLACPAITDEAECLARPDCSAFYEGIDCTNPSGTACHSGDADCTCASFEFSSCQ